MTLSSKAKDLPRGQVPLLERITQAQRKELLAFRESYRLGEFRHATLKSLTQLVIEEFSLDVLSPQTMRTFLDESPKQSSNGRR